MSFCPIKRCVSEGVEYVFVTMISRRRWSISGDANPPLAKDPLLWSALENQIFALCQLLFCNQLQSNSLVPKPTYCWHPDTCHLGSRTKDPLLRSALENQIFPLCQLLFCNQLQSACLASYQGSRIKDLVLWNQLSCIEGRVVCFWRQSRGLKTFQHLDWRLSSSTGWSLAHRYAIFLSSWDVLGMIV